MVIHLALKEDQIWCANRMSDITNVFGSECIVIHKSAPTELERFLKNNPEFEDIKNGGNFFQGFAYWVICKLFGIEEEQNRYGILKRELARFSQKLFKAVRAMAGKLAKQIQMNF